MKQLLLIFCFLLVVPFTSFAKTSNKAIKVLPEDQIVSVTTSKPSSSSLDINIDTIENNDVETTSLFSKGLYYGFAGMLILLSFICFFAFNEKMFFHFGNVVIAALVVFLYHDQLVDVLYFLTEEQNLLVKSALLVIFSAFAANFSSKYLHSNPLFPIVNNTVRALLSLAIIAVLVGTVFEAEVNAIIANTLCITTLLIYMSIGVILFSKRNYAKFYVIGAFFPLLFSIDYFITQPFGFHFLGIELVHLKSAVLAEILLMTYAIIFRMKELKDEKLVQQTALKIYLKNKEVTARKKTELYIKDQYLENIIMHYDLSLLEIKLLQYISEDKSDVKIMKKLRLSEVEFDELTTVLYDKLEIKKEVIADYSLLATQPDYIYN